ncbi:hypothetical protein AAE478_003088 [Parahypoxylon ruwenzoriense]
MSVLGRLAARYTHGVRANRQNKTKLRKKTNPVRGSDDGQDSSLFSRQRDTMDQVDDSAEGNYPSLDTDTSTHIEKVLSPAIRQLGFDGIDGPPFSGRSPSPGARSIESLTLTEASSSSWDREVLLSLSDSVRESLRRDGTVGPAAEKLSGFLEAALQDEEETEDGGQPLLDFETIEYARLDKLLAEILRLFGSLRVYGPDSTVMTTTTTKAQVDNVAPRFRIDVSHAKSLSRAWRRRFREQYFMMDQRRSAVMVEGGRLKDVSFDGSLTSDLGRWRTQVNDPISELEGDLQFELGHWWLNITCAERDGIVASSLEVPTKGRYVTTTLPLLTGQEENIGENTYKYIREGRSSDMHIALISQVGRQIRVLRGYRLKSILAPQAGVRYDGLFAVRQYGCKLDDQTNLHRLELTLERVIADPEQNKNKHKNSNKKKNKSLEEMAQIPRPSQLDDWALYEKLEGDKIKLLQGDSSYLEWKLRRQEEKIDREEWRRARLFRASFSQDA